MTETLVVTIKTDKAKLYEKLKAKARNCGSPLCWTIRDPIKSKSQVWLKPKEIGKKNGRYVSLRRILFYLEYDNLPHLNIYMVCDNDKAPEERGKCVNPSHARMSGWENDDMFVHHIPLQIERGILYPEDAQKWFGYRVHREKEAATA